MYNVKRGKIQEVCISEQNRGTIQTPVDNELFFSFFLKSEFMQVEEQTKTWTSVEY